MDVQSDIEIIDANITTAGLDLFGRVSDGYMQVHAYALAVEHKIRFNGECEDNKLSLAISKDQGKERAFAMGYFDDNIRDLFPLTLFPWDSIALTAILVTKRHSNVDGDVLYCLLLQKFHHNERIEAHDPQMDPVDKPVSPISETEEDGGGCDLNPTTAYGTLTQSAWGASAGAARASFGWVAAAAAGAFFVLIAAAAAAGVDFGWVVAAGSARAAFGWDTAVPTSLSSNEMLGQGLRTIPGTWWRVEIARTTRFKDWNWERQELKIV